MKPNCVYHVTPIQNVTSILSQGLLINPPKRVWGISKNAIYFAYSMKALVEYAETMMSNEDVAIIRICTDSLDKSKFAFDPLLYKYGIYKDNIPPELLENTHRITWKNNIAFVEEIKISFKEKILKWIHGWTRNFSLTLIPKRANVNVKS